MIAYVEIKRNETVDIPVPTLIENQILVALNTLINIWDLRLPV